MFKGLLFDFISLFGSHFSDIYILFIILIFILCLVSYDLHMLLNIKKSLKKLNNGVNELTGYGAENVRKLDDMIDSRTNSALRNAWEACHNDFRHIMNREKMPCINEYINIYNVITVPARRKGAEAVPGILSMAGLLGTFLYIISGLADSDLIASIQVQGGFHIFFNLITASFSISITAFILSILFQLLDRQLYHSTVSELNMFLNMVNRKIPMANESGSLELLLREQQNQTEAIQKLGDDISAQLSVFIGKQLVPSIYKSFEDTIKNQIAPSIKIMSDMLYQLSEVAYDTQTRGVQSMVDSFISKLTSTMGLQFEKLGESFREILEYQAGTDKNISRLIEELSGNAELQKEVNNHTRAVLEEIGCYQQQTAEMNSSLAGNIESMHKFNDTVREMVESDRKSLEELDNRRQVLQNESSEYFSKMDGQIHRLLEELSLQLDAAFSHFNDITSVAFESLNSSMKTTIESISDNMTTLTDNMDDQVRDISIYARGLSEEVAELNNRLENAVKDFGNQMNDGVVKTLDNFDDGLSDICSRFGRVISEIKDAVDDIPAIMEMMRSIRDEKREMAV